MTYRTIDPIGVKAEPRTAQERVSTIDITPTWEAVLPILMVALEAGTFTGRQAAEQELRRMARLADAYVATLKKDR